MSAQLSPLPFASLSLDLDDKWSYLKIHGNPEWTSFPSYFETAIPRILRFLAEEDLKITFFIVGQDAALEKNQDLLRSITDAGHEIGNHSFHHESWLHRYEPQKIREELLLADEAIARATGVKPLGFRGPGFSLSENVLRVLHELGYLYDCSTWPTFIGPLARTYYFSTKKFSAEEREVRDLLFGAFSEGFRPLSGYHWDNPARGLIEIPVSTLPIFRLPVHVSYLLYLSLVSPKLSDLYTWLAYSAFRLTKVSPSLLLHPLDFMGREDDSDLAFFPGMKVPAQGKIDRVRKVLRHFKTKFTVGTMKEHAERISAQERHWVKPAFPAFDKTRGEQAEAAQVPQA